MDQVLTQADADQFLAELFSTEYCAECEGDAQHHAVCVTPIGNLFARCGFPMSEATKWQRHPVIADFHANKENL